MQKITKKHIKSWYKQCTFSYPTTKGRMVQTAWIPENLAVKGKEIYFGKKTDKPEQLWIITSVSNDKVSDEYLRNHERDFMTQRQASDI